MPCRNEALFLPSCIDSILASDYPADRMELLLADGRSTDGTRRIIARYSGQDSRVRIIDNPGEIAPAGLNRAIEAARGEIIVRLDAHATIAPDYIRRAVDHLGTTGASNVGGAMRTIARDRGWFAAPIRIVLEHPFGVGNSYFRTAGAAGDASPRWVDTVFGGCWRREVFDRVGPFNERLARGQDLEFNLRLARAGGRILLAPDLRIDYFARATLLSFWRHNWTNGVWAILPFAYSGVMPVRARHLIPMLFCVALAGSVAARSPLIFGLYAAASLIAALQAAWRERKLPLAPLLALTFASLHLAYGFGSVWGAIRLAGMILIRWASPSRELAPGGNPNA